MCGLVESLRQSVVALLVRATRLFLASQTVVRSVDFYISLLMLVMTESQAQG